MTAKTYFKNSSAEKKKEMPWEDQTSSGSSRKQIISLEVREWRESQPKTAERESVEQLPLLVSEKVPGWNQEIERIWCKVKITVFFFKYIQNNMTVIPMFPYIYREGEAF